VKLNIDYIVFIYFLSKKIKKKIEIKNKKYKRIHMKKASEIAQVGRE
jgi:Na+-driven multidrug efflux pump